MRGAMGDKLEATDEILYRQIHPNSIDAGEPGSDRFRPSELDKNMLSTDRSALTTAADSHALYTSTGRQSKAVFGLSIAEFNSESITCFSDPLKATEATPTNAAHALADYSAHSTSKQKLVAKRLKRLAVARGCLHPTAVVLAVAKALT
jgi:hypothetical protein